MTPLLVVSLAVAASAAAAPPETTREQAIERARRLVGEGKGIDEAALTVVAAVAVRFPDGGLGCPEKDRVYSPEVTPGWRVALRAGPQAFDVRVSRDRALVCPPRTTAKLRPEEVRAGLRLQRQAREHLAAALGVDPAAVRVRFMKPTTWPDAGLGCGPTGAAPGGESPTPGFRIELEHEGRTFSYHSDLEKAVPCPGP